jgi:DNA-binding transcriptional regulator YhcF (GntR family)
MPRTRDESSGKYAESYPPDLFVETIHGGDGMASTTEVANAVGCVYDTAYKKLRGLEDDGRITSRKVANARLWMIAESAEEST